MLREAPFYSNAIATLLGSAVDDVVTDHIGRVSQEHQITAKVADRMEQAVNNWSVGKYKLSAKVQDLPDKGRGSLEKKIGADLFIGIRLQDESSGYSMQKGLLIQSKIGSKTSKSIQKNLAGQCEEMNVRSPSGAFVWIYNRLGTSVVPAGEVAKNPNIDVRAFNSRNTTQFFKDTLDCFAGDPNLIFGDIFNSNDDFNGFLNELSIRKGLLLAVDAD